MVREPRHFTETPARRQLFGMPVGVLARHLVILLWGVLLIMLLLGSLPAWRFLPETSALKKAAQEASAVDRHCSPVILPQGVSTRRPETMRGTAPEGHASHYLVTRFDNPRFPSPLPLNPGPGLKRLAAYAAALEEGCSTTASIAGISLDGTRPSDLLLESFDLSAEAPCPLALIRADQVHPGLKVISGPFGPDGSPGADGETLDLTILGPVQEPAWLARLGALRRFWGVEAPNPLEDFRGLAGAGRLLVPAGRDWSGLKVVHPEENLGRWFAAMLRPPYPTYPLLLSLASAPKTPDALRRSLELALSAPYIRPTELPADDQDPTRGTTVVRALGRPGVVLWELVVPLASVETWVSRVRGGLARQTALELASEDDLAVALVHWADLPLDCHLPRESQVELLNALADEGFQVVVGVSGGPGPGPVWTRGKALVASNLGDFAGPSDLLGGVSFRDDFGLVLNCTRLGPKPFQCYTLPIQRYLGRPHPAYLPKARATGPCLWREEDWRRPLAAGQDQGGPP